MVPTRPLTRSEHTEIRGAEPNKLGLSLTTSPPFPESFDTTPQSENCTIALGASSFQAASGQSSFPRTQIRKRSAKTAD